MAETIIGKHIQCEWCRKNYDTPRYMLGYDDKYFCDDECLGEYLVNEKDGDIEQIWFDTPDNLKMIAEERKAEW